CLCSGTFMHLYTFRRRRLLQLCASFDVRIRSFHYQLSRGLTPEVCNMELWPQPADARFAHFERNARDALTARFALMEVAGHCRAWISVGRSATGDRERVTSADD